MAAGPRRDGKAVTAAIFLATASFVLLADLLTKSLAFSQCQIPRAVIPGFLDFHLNRNLGAVFGIAQGKGAFFIVFTLIAAAGIVWAVAAYGRTSRWLTFGLGCVLGGALGNLVDRLTVGSVRDFIDVYVRARHWPTFNVADMAICTGAAILVLWAFRAPREESEKVRR
jgi:signal peptidase II